MKKPISTKRVYKIDVHGPNGYSFAVRQQFGYESEAIENALKQDLFQCEEDAEYATAEEITDSEYDLKGLANATYDIPLE